MWYGCGNTSLSNPSTMRITLARDGTLTFFNGAVDIGQGSSTVLLQIAADALGLPPRAFRMVVGDTDLTADAGKTSASRQTFVSGNAARLAGEDLRRKILALANAGPDARLTLEGARLTIADGEASRTIDLATLRLSSRESRASEISGTQADRSAGSRLSAARSADDDVPRRPRHLGPADHRRSTRTARASPTPPTASPRRWPRWRSTRCSAPSRCSTSSPRTTSAAPSTRRWSRARSTAASPRGSASR